MLGYVYSPVNSACKLFFTLLHPSIVRSIVALKSTVATSGALSVKGMPLPLLSGFSPGVGFFCISIRVAQRTGE